MKKILSLIFVMFTISNISLSAKTLVVYYSYTGNCHQIVETLISQIDADTVRIYPEDKTQRYEANNYAIGTQLLNAINADPYNADSYPAIDPVDVDLANYDTYIIVTPLWWSQMAAILQTYLFHHGPEMAGKNVGLIVSSYSSGISTVVANAQRLIPDAAWMGDALWINNANHRNRATLIENWLIAINYEETQHEASKMYITIDGVSQSVTLEDNTATETLMYKLQDGPVTITLNSSGGFEIWGPLGFSLPTSNQQITAQPGDVILYNGSNICLFYGSNSWSYTRLGHIDGLSQDELRTFLKAGESNISVTLSLSIGTTGKVGDVNGDNEVTIGDVTALIDILLSGNTNNPRADVNGDSEVSIGDVTALIDILLNSAD